MRFYTTCARCGKLLDSVEYWHDTHPLCEPRDTTLDDYIAAVISENDAEADRLGQILDADPGPPRLAAAVKLYASWGWPVFPLKAGQKVPATKNGFKDATTDLDRLMRWWDRNPHSNIGLPTGHAFDVVDVDAPKGWPSYDQMVVSGALPDIHGHVYTAGGGYHLYVPASGEGNRAGILPGIDIRGLGGYVVAPPSQDPRGRYTFLRRPSPVLTGALRGRKAA